MIETGLGAALGWGLGSSMGNFINNFRARKTALHRLEQELSLMDDPNIPGHFYAWRCGEDDEFSTNAIIVILDTTSIYFGGTFHFEIRFREDHPRSPPSVRIITPIHHINFGKAGPLECAFGMIHKQWNASYSMATILMHLSDLISHPTEDKHCKYWKLEEYKTRSNHFENVARHQILSHAWDPLAFFLARRCMLRFYPMLKDMNITYSQLKYGIWSSLHELQDVDEMQHLNIPSIIALARRGQESVEVPWSPAEHEKYFFMFDTHFRITVRTLLLLYMRAIKGLPPFILDENMAEELFFVVFQYLAPRCIPKCLLKQ